VPAYGWVPPPVTGYDAQRPEWASWPKERRLEEARRLYREAGYSEEHPLELELRYPTREDYKRVGIVVAALWKQRLGVSTQLVNEEFKVFLAHARQRAETQAVMLVWQGDYDDATTFLDTLQGRNGFNYAGWSDDRYDALLDAAGAAVDPAQRRSTLAEAERRLLEESPIVPLYHVTSRHLIKPAVEGWEDNVLDHHYTKDLRVRPAS
jgi:oligopeptide transport system substrate-binding protein